jgi:hypothetical protein
MLDLTSLWLPILGSAILVFVASSAIHMALPWHKSDYPKLPDEAAVAAALKPLAIPPGDYMLPRATSREEFRDPQFLARLTEGPVLVMSVRPNGMPAMGKTMAGWFVYCLAVSLICAYLASVVVPRGAPPALIWRVVGITAFVSYTLALYQMSIWYWRAWSITLKSTVDGVIYALVTAGLFVVLWP